jgi:pimeloyl-ACP methyl ester carboxylesterase
MGISPEVLDHFAALASLDWSDRGAVAEFLVEIERLCAADDGRFDAGRARARVEEVLKRTESPASMFNHTSLTTREDWSGRFREIDCPVLVLHGERDPILPLENGGAIAAGIAGASLVVMVDTGHEIPLVRIPLVAEKIAAHAGSLPL